ncbi:MAG: cytochrome c biogenesis protein ResB, partial [Pseudomonadota bacterium]
MPRNNVSRPAILVRFLGSMNLAITLLVAVAIAPVIGTVLQQNQPYGDYLLKFGPFWFEIFRALDLYHVYSSTWFLTVLGFLVLSTGVCVYRNTPRMLRDIRDYRENTQEASLRRLKHHSEWTVEQPIAECVLRSRLLLARRGYRSRTKNHLNTQRIACIKGAGSRWGYIFTHAAIVIICVGGLIDGNLPLKLRDMRGQIAVETHRIPATQVPAASTLGPDNLAFRALMTIPEGDSANLAFITFRDGYLVQRLPFRIEAADFRIEHYQSGQPKSFESDLVIHDPALDKPIRQTISVNHPLTYKGISIYQSSFGDGGSTLNLTVWPLAGRNAQSRTIQSVVDTESEIQTSRGPLTLEMSDFRPFNVNPDAAGIKKFRNLGPSFQFKLRRETGEAREYINYMRPIEREGAFYYLSGVRSSPAEAFVYLYIPADPEGEIERFMAFRSILANTARVAEVALTASRASLENSHRNRVNSETVADFLAQLVSLFANGGLAAIASRIEESVPEAQREVVTQTYLAALRLMLRTLYGKVLAAEGVQPDIHTDEANG